MKIIVGITGASGSIYAEDLLERLLKENTQINQVAVIRSKNAEQVWNHEIGKPWPKHEKLVYFDKNNFMAPFASGSSAWDAMVIIPASMGTIGRVAHGFSDDLISRAADVMLKEKKSLLICPRELPFNEIHVQNLMLLQRSGATIFPTSPSFYSKPQTIKALIGTVTSRIVDHLGIQQNVYRWGENIEY